MLPFGGLIRRVIFLSLLIATVGWAYFGWGMSQRWTAAWNLPKKNETEQLIDRLEARDADAAKEIRELKARSDARAFAMIVAETDRKAGLDGLRKLALTSRDRGKPVTLQLAELALDPSLADSREQREAVLVSHGNTLQALFGDGSGASVADYMDRLKAASMDRSSWSFVRDDPVGLVVWVNVEDPDLRSYYSMEREWLGSALAEVVDSPQMLNAAIKVARDCHPLPKQAITDLGLGAAGLELFVAYCPILHESVEKRGLPLDEVLEVIYANRDYFDEAAKHQKPEAIAEELSSMRANKKAVWNNARNSALALRLNQQAPNVANRLLDQYGHDDVAAFLFAGYENEIAPAAASIDRFGDLGFYVLNKYREDPRLHKFLADESIGVRIVPYLARFGDAGLDQVSANRAWLDKYFDASGKEISKEWWTQIPGGALADVIRNWKNGVPNEWGELGWGALDAADAALLVASFGATAGASAGKQAAKQAAKRVVLSSAQRSTLRTGARAAAREAAAAGRATSLLRRAAQGARTGVISAARAALRPAEAAVYTVRRASAGWQAIPPNVRIWTARALLGAGLFATIKYRTAPMVVENVGKAIEEIARKPLESLGEGLRRALETFGVDPGVLGSAAGIGLYAAVLLLLLGSSFVARPRLAVRRV